MATTAATNNKQNHPSAMVARGHHSAGQNRLRLAGIVLAAGRASRFGSDKRLAKYSDSQSLIGRSTQLIQPHCEQIWVVNRPGDEENAELLNSFNRYKNVSQFVAPNALHGMGSSLANAVEQVLASEEALGEFDGLIVMLADMPYIHEETIAKLVDNFQADKIIIPSYREAHCEKKWGNPVMFGRKWFAALSGLNGDRGAKSLIKANPCARIEVVVEDAGILKDVDSPGDLC